VALEAGQLTIEIEGSVVQTLHLSMDLLTIGREPSNALPLPHPMISRRHAELRMLPEGPVLTDLGSSNGTRLHGERILPHQPALLAHGAVFEIGPYTFTYYAPLPQPVAEPPPAPVPAQEAFVAAEPPPVPVPVAPVRAVPLESTIDFTKLPPPPPLPPRPTWPLPPAPHRPSIYLQDLPSIFQDGDFLGRFLLIMESIWEPLEQRQDHIDAYFDPATSPASFLPWLASWIDPTLNTRWPEKRLRALLAEAMNLYRWRGTRYGVARMIELCTGLTPQITEDPAAPFVFRVRLTVSSETGVDPRLVEAIIRTQKPAHTGYVLEMSAA
jgi:phage tail-like protein